MVLIQEEWEEKDSCWGFYGKLDDILDYIISETVFKMEDLVEENV